MEILLKRGFISYHYRQNYLTFKVLQTLLIYNSEQIFFSMLCLKFSQTSHTDESNGSEKVKSCKWRHAICIDLSATFTHKVHSNNLANRWAYPCPVTFSVDLCSFKLNKVIYENSIWSGASCVCVCMSLAISACNEEYADKLSLVSLKNRLQV